MLKSWFDGFPAARFGQLFQHPFVFGVLRNDDLRHVFKAIKDMVNRAQRVHQFKMENINAGFRTEFKRNNLAIVKVHSIPGQDFPVLVGQCGFYLLCHINKSI